MNFKWNDYKIIIHRTPPSAEVIASLLLMRSESGWSKLEDEGAYLVVTPLRPFFMLWATRKWTQLTGMPFLFHLLHHHYLLHHHVLLLLLFFLFFFLTLFLCSLLVVVCRLFGEWRHCLWRFDTIGAESGSFCIRRMFRGGGFVWTYATYYGKITALCLMYSIMYCIFI